MTAKLQRVPIELRRSYRHYAHAPVRKQDLDEINGQPVLRTGLYVKNTATGFFSHFRGGFVLGQTDRLR